MQTRGTKKKTFNIEEISNHYINMDETSSHYIDKEETSSHV